MKRRAYSEGEKGKQRVNDYSKIMNRCPFPIRLAKDCIADEPPKEFADNFQAIRQKLEDEAESDKMDI